MSGFLSQILGILTQWISPQPQPIPSPTPTPIQPPATPDLVVNAINATRASNNLPSLLLDSNLEQLATSWAQRMASAGQLDHGDFASRISACYPNTAAGEDIAEGQPSGDAVVQAWMNSPPHRANILGAFNRVGAGSARGQDGTLYWCADFDQTA